MFAIDLKDARRAVNRWRHELNLIDGLSRDQNRVVIDEDLHNECCSVLYKLCSFGRKLDTLIGLESDKVIRRHYYAILTENDKREIFTRCIAKRLERAKQRREEKETTHDE